VERGAIHDDHVAGGQLRSQHFLCPCVEHVGIGVAFEAHRRFEYARAVTRNQRGSADALAGHIADGAHTAWRPRMRTQQAFFDPGFIDPHDVFRWNLRDHAAECRPLHLVALAIQQRFFYA